MVLINQYPVDPLGVRLRPRLTLPWVTTFHSTVSSGPAGSDPASRQLELSSSCGGGGSQATVLNEMISSIVLLSFICVDTRSYR